VNDLTLPEELLLLSLQRDPQAHREESCKRALAAAHVAELAVRLRLQVQRNGLFRKLVVTDRSTTGDPLLDSLLFDLAKTPTSPDAARARAEDDNAALIERLVDCGLLDPEESQTRFLHRRRTRYRLIGEAALRDVDERIVVAVGDPASADLRTVALIAVAYKADFLPLWAALMHGSMDGDSQRSLKRRQVRAIRPAAYKELVASGQVRDDSAEAAAACDALAAIAETAAMPWEGGGG
jgi:hypothetical protein